MWFGLIILASCVNIRKLHNSKCCFGVCLKVLVEKPLLGKEIFTTTLAFQKSGRILLRTVKTSEMVKKYAEVKINWSNSISAKTVYIWKGKQNQKNHLFSFPHIFFFNCSN